MSLPLRRNTVIKDKRLVHLNYNFNLTERYPTMAYRNATINCVDKFSAKNNCSCAPIIIISVSTHLQVIERKIKIRIH